MEKLKEADNSIMQMRIKVAKKEPVTDGELYELQQLLFKAQDDFEKADRIVRRLAELEDNWLSPMTLIHEARAYITNNPKEEGGEGE